MKIKSQKKSGGRKKYQDSKQLDPVGKTWWQNMEINSFGVWANNPQLELVSKIETLRLQIEAAKDSGMPSVELLKIEATKRELREELGRVAMEASLKTDVKFFNDFALLLEWFASGPVGVDPVRTKLMLEHELLRLSLWRNPTKAELLKVIQVMDEFNGMDEKQLRKTFGEAGTALYSKKDIESIQNMHSSIIRRDTAIPNAQEFHRLLLEMKHPLVAENFLAFKHMCNKLGLSLLG